MVTNKILCSMNNRLNRAEVFQGGDFTTSYMELGSIQYTQTQTGTSRYRYVGDDPKTVQYGDLTQESTRYTGSKATLYANGQAVATNRSASLYDNGRAYFGTDILGSVRSATDDYATLEDRYEYDIFGTPYEGDFTSGLNNGYTGKPYDTITGLYNYGYRDYSPQQARFTTVDPIRDGNNWFSYVVNDPVNYVDLWGLCADTVDDENNGPIDQNDPSIADISDGAMGTSGCNYRSLQNVAEHETGLNLTAEQIEESVEDLIESGAIEPNMYVNNPDAVIHDAFVRLGQPDITATVGYGGNGDDPDYTIIWGDTPNNSNEDDWDHARLGDEDENLIFDPYSPDIQNMTEGDVNEVFLHH